MTRRTDGNGAIEPMLSVQQVCNLWHASPDLVRKVFRDRVGRGVMLLGGRGKKSWRIPVSLVLEAMIEMGYTREQADRVLKQAV